MAARPGRVFEDVRIEAPYPRDDSFRTSSVYNENGRRASEALHAAMEERRPLSAVEPSKMGRP